MTQAASTPTIIAAVEPPAGAGINVSDDRGLEDYTDAMRWAEAIEAYTRWMIAAGIRPRTVELRRYQLRRLAEAHLHRSPWRVSGADLVGWLSAQDWAPETRRSYRAALQGFYRWARQTGRTKRDPAAALPVVRAPAAAPRPAPDHVLTTALERATDRDRLILLLAGYAALRRAEIARLRWADIDFDRRIMRVRGKGGRTRAVPLRAELAAALSAELARRRGGGRGTGFRYAAGTHADGRWVFPGRWSGHMDPGAVGKAAARALGRRWTGHTLRHRFATRAYDRTRDLLAVQELLGHAKPETTMRYVQRSGDALRRAVDAV